MTINRYLATINQRYQNGISTEHSYRGDLLSLLETLLPALSITNEPKRIDVGAPDYILMRDEIPVGFIEAKDIGDADLDGKKAHKEQFDRYKATQDPYIFTDYLHFHLYLQGDFITSIRIADIEDGQIVPRPARFDEFSRSHHQLCLSRRTDHPLGGQTFQNHGGQGALSIRYY